MRNFAEWLLDISPCIVCSSNVMRKGILALWDLWSFQCTCMISWEFHVQCTIDPVMLGMKWAAEWQTKWPVRTAKTRISLDIRPVWSVFTVSMKKHLVLIYPLSAQWRLIRLGWCPGWLTQWWPRSFCRFCHAAAQIFLHPINCLTTLV